MDINSIPTENDKERDFDFVYSQCFYAIIKCPPAIGTPTGSLAFITYIPENNEECGVLQCFNPEKNTSGHAFHTSTKLLRAKYTALKKLVIKTNKAELVLGRKSKHNKIRRNLCQTLRRLDRPIPIFHFQLTI